MAGVRSSKTVGSTTYKYDTLSGKVMRQSWGSNVIDFVYDENNQPYAMRYNGTVYYYVLNVQGDVVGLLNSSGAIAVEYTYDPWGKLLNINTHGSTPSMDVKYRSAAEANPLRYRGYYYDTETGFYYLQTRYYDPAICRFINADTYTTTDADGLLSTNMFAYCENNPVMGTDPTGEFLDTVFDVISLCTSVAEVVANPADPMAWAGLAGDVVDLIPGVTGVGETVRAVNTARKAAKKADKVVDAAKNGNKAKNAVKTAGKKTKCFVAGTLVLTDSGYVPIEEIQAGDKVWATDPETGQTELKEIVQTFENEAAELVHVSVAGNEIVCTNEHPFYSPVKGWTAACKLRAGDVLVTVNGELVVVEWVQHELLEAPVKVYNFEVEGFHTYYVGDDGGVLVHNTCSNRGQLKKNMLREGPAPGPNYQAHHGLPWKHKDYFSQAGLDINEARFGRWVRGGGNGGHQSWSYRYGALWDKYVECHPTADANDIIDYYNKLNGRR